MIKNISKWCWYAVMFKIKNMLIILIIVVWTIFSAGTAYIITREHVPGINLQFWNYYSQNILDRKDGLYCSKRGLSWIIDCELNRDIVDVIRKITSK
jgi:hypothetical protein